MAFCSALFRWVLLASLSSGYPLCAGLEEYFKKAEGKADVHKMQGIDFIYMINLDQRPEKHASSLEEFYPFGITPYRFSAVNGWELSFETINAVGVKLQPGMKSDIMGTSYFPEDGGRPRHGLVENIGQTYFCHCMAQGPIGIVLSHLSVLQDAYDSGYETIWVMEDDVQVIRNPHLISGLIQELDRFIGHGGWDLLFTDQDTKNNRGEYVPCQSYAQRPNFTPDNPAIFQIRHSMGGHFTKLGARYGAYSMIVRRSGMKKILDFIKAHAIFLPYDMDFYLPPGMKLFAVTEDVVSTRANAISDNGGANYLKK